MQTIMDKTKTLILKKFHTMCGKAGINEEQKREMIAAYGVTSSRDLTARELLDLCEAIERMVSKDAAEINKWRKRVIASIFGWRKAMGKETSMTEVKAIACRAADAGYFNAIPLERLRSLYYAFAKKTKDLQFVEKLTADELDISAWMN